ncbi:TraM recognition domain-containing protein [Actinoallomurus purpureus]|uniref:TraM recognition domain-containing protein n=1 Tax=Actinoallomurus purpureus TaxID=478114 RepID=UPI002092B432|nr:TraM recognition domain-containing protein [Actinoallomurus purpureus]MCO6009155.1 TraM recognition domain-containing protein [Actinoallomurus purpureus]
MRPGEPDDSIGYLIAAMGLAGLAVVILALVPAICGSVIFFLLRRWLARRDWIIVAVAGLVGFAWYLKDNALSYGYWLLSFVNVGKTSSGHVPVTVLLCLGAMLAGAGGAILGSPIAGAGGAILGSQSSTGVSGRGFLFRRRLVQDSLTPRKGRRESLKRRVSSRVTPRDVPAVRGPYATEKSRRLPLKAKEIPIGLGSNGRMVRLSTREMGMHGCVVGSTGSGKTITLMWIIGAALDMGFDVTVIDMKEDTEPGGLRDFLRAYSTMHRVPLQEIALGDEDPKYWFNVLADMTADEAFDTIMSLVEFDDAYWKALNRKVLQQVVQICHQAAEVAPDRFHPATMLELGKIMEMGTSMKNAVKDRIIAIDAVEGVGYCKNRYTNVLSPSPDEAKSAASFGTKMTGLYDSTAGRRILIPGDDRKMIDVRLEGLTYIGLNSLGQPDMARILSSSSLQRLSVYAAQRIQGRAPKERPRLIVVDEANFIDRDIAMNMLSRVRSALFNMILCTQGPTDWIDADGDDWSRLTQNINWLIAMAQSSPEAAEKCAEFLGMRDNGQVSQRVENGRTVEMGTVSVKEEFIVTAKELRDLGTGEAYLRVNKPDSRVAYVAMPMRSQELQWYEQQLA